MISAFTIIQHEPVFFPLWYQHYSKHLDAKDIYVLHHVLPPPKTELQDQRKTEWENWLKVHQATYGYNLINIINDKSFDHEWLRQTVMHHQRELLCRYKIVLFAEADEIIAPHPDSQYKDNLITCISDKVEHNQILACDGYEVVHNLNEETAIDLCKPLLMQRKYWYWSKMYSKPLISKIPLDWCVGFHACTEMRLPCYQRDKDLLLIHLHKMDWDICLQRNLSNVDRTWVDEKLGCQNRLISEKRLKDWWQVNIDQTNIKSELNLMPEIVRKNII